MYQTHIPQPPHSAGLRFKGLRPAVDPTQIPSPIEAMESDKAEWETKIFHTLPGSHAPLCTSEFVALDQGNSSPKFIRMSTWNMPSTSRVANDSGVPIYAIIQPFAELDPREEPVPVVDFGEEGPPRCARCNAYINPWVRWVGGGVRFKCNLCKHETEVPSHYFSNLDATQVRLDHAERPELNKGTIDFNVTSCPTYWAQHPPVQLTPSFFSHNHPTGNKKPEPLRYLFMLDVSMDAVSSGWLQSMCSSISEVLYGEESVTLAEGVKVGFVTVDSTIHFYDLSKDSETPPMLVVADLEEPFAPINEGLFVDPIEKKSSIQSLLSSIPQRFWQTTISGNALGSALRAGLSALALTAGHILLFHSTIPTIGLGALSPTPPSETELVNTSSEYKLFTQREAEWILTGEECALHGVGVSMWLAPLKYVDVASISVVSEKSGGSVFWHPRFDEHREGSAVRSELGRVLMRWKGFNCSLKVRCSNGLRTIAHHGLLYPRPLSEYLVASLDSDKSISVTLDHIGKLSPREYAYIQAAVLYTTETGERRVRVCNLAMNVVELVGSVFQYGDMEALISGLAKEAMENMKHQKMSSIREHLTEKCAQVLLGYRTNCAASAKPSELIIPEAFRSLPAFTLALQKSKPLKASSVSLDVRNIFIHRIKSLTPRALVHFLYPQLLPLHDLEDNAAVPVEVTYPDGNIYHKVIYPSCVRSSYWFMEPGGIYLIDNGEWMIFWVSNSASPQLLQDLFEVDDIQNIGKNIHELPTIPTVFSTQVRNIISHRFAERGHRSPISIVRQDMDGLEIEFSDMLVEDENNGAMSYTNYLATVHRHISSVLSNGGSFGGGSSFRGGSTPW
ncbi:sec24-related protein [Cyathus striatus]|nr:sec24-related protein [Cyathus striatus]